MYYKSPHEDIGLQEVHSVIQNTPEPKGTQGNQVEQSCVCIWPPESGKPIWQTIWQTIWQKGEEKKSSQRLKNLGVYLQTV